MGFLRYTLLFAAIMQALIAHAQILNVEKSRLDDDTSKNFNGGFELEFVLNNRSADRDNQIQFIGISMESDLNYLSENHSYILISNLDYSSVTGDPIIRTGFVHLRANFLHKKDISYENYTQLQFDLGRGLTVRWLAGGGLRFKLIESKKRNLFLGTGIMYEHEQWEDPTQESRVVTRDILKSSNYVSTFLKISDHVDLNLTSYYQVGYDQISDVFRHRISFDTGLSFEVSKVITFTTTFIYAYENRPIVPIVKYLYVLNNGIKINF